jgi:glycosyltransferase involved in cell wall biosynthesis
VSIKILTLVSDLGRGGTQRCAQNYALLYRDAGFSSIVATWAGSGVREHFLRAENISVVAADIPGVLRSLAQIRPTVVHIHRSDMWEKGPIEIILTARKYGCIVIQTNVFGRPDYSSAAKAVHLDLQLSDWCYIKWRYTTLGYARPPSVVVPYFVNEHSFVRRSPVDCAEVRQRHGIPRDSFLIGRIGQPIAAKWSLDIVRASEQLMRTHSRVFLLCVGAPAEIEERIRTSEFRNRMAFTAPIDKDDELSAYYSAMDVFAHSSQLGESFGMVLVEAMLCGVPIVTRARPFRDNSQCVIVARKNGIVAWSNRAFDAAINAALSNGLTFKESRSYAVSRFGWARGLATLSALIEVVTNAKASEWEARLVERGVIARPQSSFTHLGISSGFKPNPALSSAIAFVNSSPVYRVASVLRRLYRR